MSGRVDPTTGHGHRFKDLAGRTFGRLLVLSESGIRNGGVSWNCVCSCGNNVVVASGQLQSGGTKSCGCLHKERTSEAVFKHGHSRNRRPEYNVWLCMRSRCNTKTNPAYPRYGGRGIKVCDRWNSYGAFWCDMGPRPSPEHSIDRIDNNGNYEPGNCRWATWREQNENKRSNVSISHLGRTMTFSQWERFMGYRNGLIASRIFNGWTPIRALTQKPRKSSPRK